jgi:methionine biosynthesis protein MetW
MAAQLELVRAAPLDLDARPGRGDHDVIARMVDDGASVLDVGCGDGALIQTLTRECKARVRGLERDKAKVRGCVVRGLSVVQGDAEADLAEFPSASFNYVVLSHSLLAMARPRDVLRQAGRVGERVIVSVANAGFLRTRFKLAMRGRVPPQRGVAWADGDLQRSCSLRDFADLVREMRFGIETAVPLTGGRPGAPFAKTLWRANFFAEEAVFLLAP